MPVSVSTPTSSPTPATASPRATRTLGWTRSPSIAVDMIAAHTGTEHTVTRVTRVTLAWVMATTNAAW